MGSPSCPGPGNFNTSGIPPLEPRMMIQEIHVLNCHLMIYLTLSRSSFPGELKSIQLQLFIIFILEHLRHEVLSNYIFSESSGVAEKDGGTLVCTCGFDKTLRISSRFLHK